MSIANTPRVAGPFVGNGSTTTFPFTYKVLSVLDIVVEIDSVQVTTGYTVALNAEQDNNPGGSVVFAVAPTAGQSIILTSSTALEQPVVFSNHGGFYPRVLNDSLDRLTILLQEQTRDVGRSVLVPFGETGFTLSPAASRASRFLFFDASGQPQFVAGSTPSSPIGASASEIWGGTVADKYASPDSIFDAAAPQTLTDAATIAVNMALGINFNVTLGGNRTLGNPTNAKPGQSGRIRVMQDGTGGRTLAFGANWKHIGSVPTIPTASGSACVFGYLVNGASDIELLYSGPLV